ncbi:MAG: Lysylphosphatidylglycerol synthase region [Bacteroidota bacterium]|jgi:uncharacterized protein (TIRG00374 family)
MKAWFTTNRTRYMTRILLSAALLAVILLNVNIYAVASTFTMFPWWYFIVAIALNALTLYVVALRWWVVRPSTSLMRSLHVTFESQYLSFILPSGITFDATRVLSTRSDPGGITRNVASIVIDKIIGMACVLILFGFSLITGQVHFLEATPQTLLYAILAMTVVPALIVLLCIVMRKSSTIIWIAIALLNKVFGTRLHKYALAFEELQSSVTVIDSNQTGLVYNMILAFVFQGMLVLRYFLVAYVCGFSLSTSEAIFASAIVQVATIIPIGFAGLGIKDLSYVAVLTGMGIQPATALAASLSGYPITIVFGLLGWALSGRSMVNRK